MNNFNLFFSKKTGSRYYLGDAVCKECDELIENNLFLNFHWSKKHKPILETYCFTCIKKMKDYGREVRENASYVVVKSFDCLPEDYMPIVPLPPTLINSRNLSVFEAAYVNLEAEIIDNTRLAGRSDPAAALKIKKNKEMLEKKDKELGLSQITLIERRKEIIKETRELHKLKKEDREKKEKELKERAEELEKDNLNIDEFLEGVKDSKPLIEGEERKRLN